jgi:hypothetical protein
VSALPRLPLLFRVCLLLAVLLPARGGPFEDNREPKPRNAVDVATFQAWRSRGITPARPCSDEVFVRRVFLDLMGTLPTPEEAEAFLATADPDKRNRLVDVLLAREETSVYLAMRWSDVLRVKAEYPINLWPNAAQAYHRWILNAMRSHVPLDQFARTLLTSSGSNFREPAVNFLRAVQNRSPEALAGVTALTFLGQRIERWPAPRVAGFAAFFAQVATKPTAEWKEEIVYVDPLRPHPAEGLLPDGTPVVLSESDDPRRFVADWLTGAGRRDFSRAMANRTWAWVFGRGVVQEADDLRPDNPPANPELLDVLAAALEDAAFDQRALLRLIVTSQTYQLSCIPRSDHPEAQALAAYYPIRRLEAEVLADAINAVTGTGDGYISAIPEPYTFVPEGTRAVALADASVTSPFLELFGRAPRDLGTEAERPLDWSALQRLHLLNSSHVRSKLQAAFSPQAAAEARPNGPVLDQLYLRILSRRPMPEEREAVRRCLSTGAIPAREALGDVAWALVNSPEFLHRH